VIHPVEFKGRELPPFCVVTGEVATTYVRWTAQKKHPAGAFLLILFGVLPFFIYLLATSRSVAIELPATKAVARRLMVDRKTYWGVGIAGVLLALGGGWFAVWPILLGLVLIAVSFVLRLYLQGRDWVWAYVQADGSVSIGGCSEAFAAAVDSWRPAIPSA